MSMRRLGFAAGWLSASLLVVAIAVVAPSAPTSLKLSSARAGTVSIPFPGPGTGGTGCSAGTTVYSFVHSGNSGNLANFTVRQPATPTGGGNQARVTFAAATTGNLITSHASIAIHTSGGNSTTPVELFFSGVSGFTITTSNTLTSDWSPITFTTSDELLVIMDMTGATNMGRQTAGALTYFKGGASYNQTTPGGLATDASTFAITTIEARTC